MQLFGKTRQWSDNLYTGYLSPALHSDLYLQTYLNDEMPSYCPQTSTYSSSSSSSSSSSPYAVLNVKDVEFEAVVTEYVIEDSSSSSSGEKTGNPYKGPGKVREKIDRRRTPQEDGGGEDGEGGGEDEMEVELEHWRTEEDNSKWALSTGYKYGDPNLGYPSGIYYACAADLNNDLKGNSRGGGALCLAHKLLWDALEEGVHDYDACEEEH